MATHDLLASTLRKIAVYICPHLDTASPVLFGGNQMSAQCPDFGLDRIEGYIQGGDDIPCFWLHNCRHLREGKCVTWAKGHDLNCSTRYCLSRAWVVLGHCVLLQVSRDIPGDPSHPGWLAQMDQVSNIAGSATASSSQLEACESTCHFGRSKVATLIQYLSWCWSYWARPSVVRYLDTHLRMEF